MSAFIVNKQCIDHVIHGFRRLQREGYGIARDLAKLGTESELGALLWDMNEEAVYQRYPQDRDSKGMGITEGYRAPTGMPCSLVQSFKSAECLVYQCSEGNVPETPLYKQLEELKSAIGKEIISSLPEYEKASWG